MADALLRDGLRGSNAAPPGERSSNRYHRAFLEIEPRPSLRVRSAEWVTVLQAPRALVRRWRSGATCLDISVRRGENSTTFVKVDRAFAAGREACLGG